MRKLSTRFVLATLFLMLFYLSSNGQLTTVFYRDFTTTYWSADITGSSNSSKGTAYQDRAGNTYYMYSNIKYATAVTAGSTWTGYLEFAGTNRLFILPGITFNGGGQVTIEWGCTSNRSIGLFFGAQNSTTESATGITADAPSGATSTNGNFVGQNANTFKTSTFTIDASVTGVKYLKLSTSNSYSASPSTGSGTFVKSITIKTNPSNATPSFLTASPSITLCQDASAYDFKGLMHVNDADASQTETWTLATGFAPSHGSLNITTSSGVTANSGTTDITPGGAITYTPTPGYSGSDNFTIQVSDGTVTATKQVNVTVNAAISIGTQPVSGSYIQNATPTDLSVSATGAGLSYLWYTCAADGTGSVSTGIITSNYTPSTSTVGTTYYKCIVTGTCSSQTSNVVSVIISPPTNPVISLTSGSALQSVSAGSALNSSIVYTWGGSAISATITWSGTSGSSTPPTGISVSDNSGSGPVTISGTPTVAGTYGYSITSSDGTNTSSALTGTLTVKLATPDVSAGAATPTNQGFTAQWAAVSGVTSYTIKVYLSGVEVGAAQQTGVSGTSTVITGLSANTTYTYKVTAIGTGAVPNSDESTASGSVRTLNTAKAITAFSISGQISSAINGTNISVVMPYETILTGLTPSITHSGASISLTGAQDFTSSKDYTVTAEDGSTQTYTATVTLGSMSTDNFRSKADGDWNDATPGNIWESQTNGNWYPATLTPGISAASVTIDS